MQHELHGQLYPDRSNGIHNDFRKILHIFYHADFIDVNSI
jgi:hypothetical protein